jgi:cardiolipin synthase
MSILKKPFSSKLNLRNHRKMIIVDHTTVMSGGINISKEYLCDLDEAWVDISFIIEGAAALEYEQVFWHNWFIQDEMPRVDLKYQGLKVESGSSILQVVPSGPDLERDTLYEATIYAIHQAKSRIWIVTPYFAPQDTLLDALIIALHRGVEVVILSPLNSDHLLLDITKSAFLRELEAEGAQIFLYKRTMLHAKAILIDSELAIMGSANFDARSYFYNFEIVSFIYSKRDILMLTRWIEELFSGCEDGVKKASKVQIVFENFFKIFAPAL